MPGPNLREAEKLHQMEGDKAGYERGEECQGLAGEQEPPGHLSPGPAPPPSCARHPVPLRVLPGPGTVPSCSHEGPAGAGRLQDQDLPPPAPPSAPGPRGECESLTGQCVCACHPTLPLPTRDWLRPPETQPPPGTEPALVPRCSKEHPLRSEPVGPRACPFSLHPLRDATDWAAYKQRTFIPRSYGGKKSR